MTVILHALLLDVPEELRTERLVLRATRTGMGAAVNAAVAESFPELKSWMPWSQQAQSLEESWTLPKFEIGYWIRSSCARQGIGTEATLALVDFARALGARRIEITSDARNVPSRRVAEKSGFALEGILRQSRHDMLGELADSCMYARTF